MSFTSDIIRELEQEAVVTRRYLAAVPFDQGFYRPHPKSESLGRILFDVAEPDSRRNLMNPRSLPNFRIRL